MVRKLQKAIGDIGRSPQKGSGIKPLSRVPYRILYTFHVDTTTVRIWIIDMERDTQKDYDRWMAYILKQL